MSEDEWMVELVLREPCEHGKTYGHVVMAPRAGVDGVVCDGYVERVLDPEQVMFPLQEGTAITVQDVIDALTKEEK